VSAHVATRRQSDAEDHGGQRALITELPGLAEDPLPHQEVGRRGQQQQQQRHRRDHQVAGGEQDEELHRGHGAVAERDLPADHVLVLARPPDQRGQQTPAQVGGAVHETEQQEQRSLVTLHPGVHAAVCAARGHTKQGRDDQHRSDDQPDLARRPPRQRHDGGDHDGRDGDDEEPPTHRVQRQPSRRGHL